MIVLLACLTILQSVAVDLAATETMVHRYGLGRLLFRLGHGEFLLC